MRCVAGIDIGSGFTKAVVLSLDDGEPARVLGKGACRTGVNFELAAETALRMAREAAGISPPDVAYLATTGLGRYGIPGRDVQITEITTAARGAHFLAPEARLALDIGSQCTRAISIREDGGVRAFKTNDKCAAGSGSFITRAAKYLQVELEEVGELALNATNPQPISSVCAVLAESEIINHVTNGVSVEDILRGIYDSLADRAATLLRRVGMSDALVFIGGVARQRGAVRALEERLKVKVYVPEDSDSVCALGAALLGRKRLLQTAAQDNLTPAAVTAS